MGSAIAFLINAVLQLIIWAVILQAVLSWLVAFDVINLRNHFVSRFMYFLEAVVSPLLRPFQRVIPPLGGVDITPIILLLLIMAVKDYILPRYLYPPLIALMG